jgi:flotillin
VSGYGYADTSIFRYSMLLAEADNKKDASRGMHIENIVKGIIEGETRVLVSSMTMEEIFTEREEFKKRIFRNIQGELDQFGLKIYNANVKELRDAPNSSYFESLSRKAHEGAINQARIDVAEAQRKGNVGEVRLFLRNENDCASSRRTFFFSCIIIGFDNAHCFWNIEC